MLHRKRFSIIYLFVFFSFYLDIEVRKTFVPEVATISIQIYIFFTQCNFILTIVYRSLAKKPWLISISLSLHMMIQNTF